MTSILLLYPFCRRAVAVVLTAFLLITAAQAQSPQTAPKTLIEAWTAFPNVSSVHWPYSYIRAGDATATGRKARKSLLGEYDQLLWRLNHSGYADLAASVRAWRRRIKQISRFRTPGNWAPSFLMAHINDEPPLSDIKALGACRVPQSVGVWSASGVTSLPWHSGMRLSQVEAKVPALGQGSAPEIAVVDSYGHIDHYGVQAWNYADGQIAPGTQIIATLPLKGGAFSYIRDAMAHVLADSPSGTHCREKAVNTENQSG